jgi:hypothetical protein
MRSRLREILCAFLGVIFATSLDFHGAEFA